MQESQTPFSNWAQNAKKKKKVSSSSQAFTGNARIVNIRRSVNVNYIKRQRRKGKQINVTNAEKSFDKLLATFFDTQDTF